MTVQIKRVKHLDVDYGMLQTATARGVKIRKITDTKIAIQNKQNRPSAAVRETGATNVDENPGTESQQDPQFRAACLRFDPIMAYCLDRKTDDGSRAPVRTDLKAPQCREVGIALANSRARLDPDNPGQRRANDGLIGFCTSQLGEGTTAQDPYLLKHDEQSMEIEKSLADNLIAAGCIYSGAYDGAVVYQVDRTDKASIGELTSDAAALAVVRRNATLNRAFTPYTAFGVSYRGQAAYMDISFQMYYQSYTTPHEYVTLCAFVYQLLRAALRGLAEERDSSGNYFHATLEQRNAIKNRKIVGFTWNTASITGTQGMIYEYAVPAGKLIGYGFMVPSWSLMQSATAVWIIESKILYHWHDTTVYGEDPNVVPFNEVVEGNLIGFDGTGQVQRAGQIAEYRPDITKIGFPLTPQGNSDTVFSAEDLIERARHWVGDDSPWEYAPVQDGTESTPCSQYTKLTYALTRQRENHGFGYRSKNTTTNRRAVIYLSHQIPKYATEEVYADVEIAEKLYLGTVNGCSMTVFLIQL